MVRWLKVIESWEPEMILKEFLEEFLAASEKDAAERCVVALDVKKAASHKRELMAPFLQPQRKPMLNLLVVREDVTPESLIRDYADVMSNSQGAIIVHLNAGEFNQNGILQNAALGLMTIYWGSAIDARTPQGGPSLSTEIDAVIRFRAMLEKDVDGKHKVLPEDARKLREALSMSLIDANAVIKWLENPKQPGQYA